jgi:NAD(P)-dependent dehydrogenase (short-subunit alcohol dehydrogenase family)
LLRIAAPVRPRPSKLDPCRLSTGDRPTAVAFGAGESERDLVLADLARALRGWRTTRFTRETPEEFRQVIAVNLNGCYWMAQACGHVMPPGSSIINISSVLGITTAGLPQAAYSASKAGLIGLTRDLAQQWTGREGIRCRSRVGCAGVNHEMPAVSRARR